MKKPILILLLLMTATSLFAQNHTAASEVQVDSSQPDPFPVVAPGFLKLLPLDEEQALARIADLPEVKACLQYPPCKLVVQAKSENPEPGDMVEVKVGPLPTESARPPSQTQEKGQKNHLDYRLYGVRPYTGEIRVFNPVEDFYVSRDAIYNAGNGTLNFGAGFYAVQLEDGFLIRLGAYADAQEAQLKAEQAAHYLEQEVLPYLDMGGPDAEQIWDEPMGRFSRYPAGQWEVADSLWYFNEDRSTRFWVVWYIGTADPRPQWENVSTIIPEAELLKFTVNLGCVH